MTDLRKAAEMALNALEFSLPAIEDFGSKEQLTDCHRAIMALYKSIAQPEQEPFKLDWVSYRQGVVDGAAQPEQEHKPWVGLTDDEIKKIMQRWRNGYIDIKDVEQLLKDKNI